MFLRNATVVGIDPKFKLDQGLLERSSFMPPMSNMFESYGFSPVRGDELTVTVGDYTLLRFTQGRKVMPASAINAIVAEKAAELEEQQGFRPGKKAMKELKERVIDELLPRALTTTAHTHVIVDHVNHCLLIDSTAEGTVTRIQRELVKIFEKIGLQDVRWPRKDRLTAMLQDDLPPRGFTVDDEAVLEYGSGKRIVFRKTDLYGDDVQFQAQLGASVASLAMTYNDRISFVLNDSMQLRRIKPLGVVRTSVKELAKEDRLEGELALAGAELSALVAAVMGEA